MLNGGKMKTAIKQMIGDTVGFAILCVLMYAMVVLGFCM
jgi:hypothetical protein